MNTEKKPENQPKPAKRSEPKKVVEKAVESRKVDEKHSHGSLKPMQKKPNVNKK